MRPLATPRRRLLSIAAASLPLQGDRTDPPLLRWQGSALGARGAIMLWHPVPAAARQLIGRCLDELERLERIFSLYQADSELCRLNRAGYLDTPSLDLRWLLGESIRYGALSAGAFDVTIQPLYTLYAEHFARFPEDSAGPTPQLIARALAQVDYRAIDIGPRRIRLGRAGAAVTLNGIAQGYIADRVADLLRAAGLRHVFIDLGEVRALDRQADGTVWRVGVRDPLRYQNTLHHVSLADQAMATSAGDATRFDRTGAYHHLLDPASGRSAQRYFTVTVIAPTATMADALSTAVAIMPREAGQDMLADSHVRAMTVEVR